MPYYVIRLTSPARYPEYPIRIARTYKIICCIVQFSLIVTNIYLPSSFFCVFSTLYIPGKLINDTFIDKRTHIIAITRLALIREVSES